MVSQHCLHHHLQHLGPSCLLHIHSRFNRCIPTMRSVVRVRPMLAARNYLDSINSGVSRKEWRKEQLDRLETRLTCQRPPLKIDHDDALQPMWKDLERRLGSRRPRTVEQCGGRSGRANIRPADEDYWMKEGLYHDGTEPTPEK